MFKKLIAWLRILWVLVIDTRFTILSRSKAGSKIMLVRMDAIGDFFLWSHTFFLYEMYLRDKEIILVANEAWADIAEALPLFDRVIRVNKTSFSDCMSYRSAILGQVRDVDAEICIQPTYSREILIGDSIVRASRARKKVGYYCDLSNISKWQRVIANCWYSTLLRSDKPEMHEIDRNFEFISLLTNSTFKSTLNQFPKISHLPNTLIGVGGYCVISPSAGIIERQWPIDRYARLVKAINDKFELSIVICGGKADKELAKKIIGMNREIDILDLTGKCWLGEFIEVVRNARFLVGNDSAPVHIAAAVGTPSVCILGGGHFNRFLPYSSEIVGNKQFCVYTKMECYGCNWRCIKEYGSGSPYPCIEEVNLTGVIAALSQITG